MDLKRSNMYPKVVVAFVIALLFLGMEGIFVAHLILAGEWGGILNSFGLALIPLGLFFPSLPFFITIVAIIYPLGLIWRERVLGAAAGGDSRFIKSAPAQPDQHLTLPQGETLMLERHRSLRNILSMIGVIFVVALLFALCGEVIVFALLPAFGHSTLNPFYPFFFIDPLAPPVPPPTLLDWITAAFPLVLSLGLLIAVSLTTITSQRYILIANDQGLTIKQRLQRRHFIPWHDIALFARFFYKERSVEQVTQSYLLWGREHRTTFQIDNLPAAPTLHKKSASRIDTLNTYRYTGGFEGYAADAQRLLATIAARSGAPLLTFTQRPAIIAKINQRLPHTLTLDDLADAPLADAALQPKAQETTRAAAMPAAITLRERIPPGPLLLETVIWAVIIGGLFLLFGGMAILQSAPDLITGPWLLVVWAVILAFVILLAFLVAGVHRERRVPAIVADDAGLTRKPGQNGKILVLPWDEIRAWAIMRSPGQEHERYAYIVCSERATLTWGERTGAALGGRGIKGDRRLAYQERAEQLHSVIAARTGLPLRDVTPRKPYEL